MDDHQFKDEELKNSWRIVQSLLTNRRELLFLGIGRPEILWSVKYLARAITKWSKACGKRLARSISYIHFTTGCRQYCNVGNSASDCKLGPFQDAHFSSELKDSKSTSGGILGISGSRTFVPISWTCKMQAAVSRSSPEARIISLDAGLRLERVPSLDLWDMVIDVLEPLAGRNPLHNTNTTPKDDISHGGQEVNVQH